MGFMDTVVASLQGLQGAPAYALVFAALAGSGLGLPVNEDLLLVAAAAATLAGVMEPWPLVAVAWCGVLCADLLVFHWGRRFGPQLLRQRAVARVLPPSRVERMQAALRRWGPGALFAVRFLPGLRSPLLFAAGSLKMRYRQLLLCDGLAAAIELPLLVHGVRALGGHWQEALAAVQRWQGWLVPAVALLVVGAWLTVRWRRRRARGGG